MAREMGQKTNPKPEKLITRQKTYSTETKACLFETDIHTDIPWSLFQLFEARFYILLISVCICIVTVLLGLSIECEI